MLFFIGILLLPAGLLAQVLDSAKQEIVMALEEFESGAERFPNINHGDTAIAKMQDGHYVLNIKNSSRFWALRMKAATSFTCNQLEMKLKCEAEDTTTAYGVIFNVEKKDMYTFDEYRFLVSKDGFFLVTQKKANLDIIVQWWLPCPCIKKNDYNVLRVHQGNDSTYHFYINDQFVLKKKLPPVDLSAYGYYCTQNAILYVDWLKISHKL